MKTQAITVTRGIGLLTASALAITGFSLGALTRQPVQSAPAGQSPQVQFNQRFVEGLKARIDAENPLDVFALVFRALPDEARVYPTENYYYFTFTAEGRYFWGNIRLSPEDRDKGFVHFAYFEHGNDAWWRYKLLGSEDGVGVQSLGSLRYAITFAGRTVEFQLNDLSQKPPAKLAPHTVFLGRAQDESGFQLLLLYDDQRNAFYWALDEEQGVNWSFTDLKDGLMLHAPSGFAFFDDTASDSWVLVGVDARNVQLNNYFDGPFDQLPDNFIAETRFSEFVQEAYPYTQGKIDRHGRFVSEGGRGRMAITPYFEYQSLDGLAEHVAACKREAAGDADLRWRLCFDQKLGLTAREMGAPGPAGTPFGRKKLTGRVVP